MISFIKIGDVPKLRQLIQKQESELLENPDNDFLRNLIQMNKNALSFYLDCKNQKTNKNDRHQKIRVR